MKKKLLGSICFIVGMALLGVPQASATTDITYDLTPLTIGPTSLTGGTITTDGTLGPLASSDILSWSFSLSGGVCTTPGGCSPSDSGTSLLNSFISSGSPLTATLTSLSYDFSSSTDAPIILLDLDELAYVNAGGPGGFGPPDIFVLNQGSSTNELSLSSSDFVIATVPSTPLPSALSLFGGGLGMMGLLGWRRRRKNTAVIAI